MQVASSVTSGTFSLIIVPPKGVVPYGVGRPLIMSAMSESDATRPKGDFESSP